ncbi:MAG: pilus assembly protein PilB, partial [Acidobacteria bacterium CG_4_9_14_3_um_filter_49_7]
MNTFVDLDRETLDFGLFKTIPVDLMFRYVFIPLREEGDLLHIAVGPSFTLKELDELELRLNKRILHQLGDEDKIREILKKSESSQRALEEATSDLRIQVVKEREDGEDILSLDAAAKEKSPIVKLIDTMIFNAIQKRASDIHVETGEDAVDIKYRIDGVLYQAMDKIDKKHHSSIISRIKVMTELDIAEKRIPQDGRFKVRL